MHDYTPMRLCMRPSCPVEDSREGSPDQTTGEARSPGPLEATDPAGQPGHRRRTDDLSRRRQLLDEADGRRDRALVGRDARRDREEGPRHEAPDHGEHERPHEADDRGGLGHRGERQEGADRLAGEAEGEDCARAPSNRRKSWAWSTVRSAANGRSTKPIWTSTTCCSVSRRTRQAETAGQHDVAAQSRVASR